MQLKYGNFPPYLVKILRGYLEKKIKISQLITTLNE